LRMVIGLHVQLKDWEGYQIYLSWQNEQAEKNSCI